jgi:hypothetical protein
MAISTIQLHGGMTDRKHARVHGVPVSLPPSSGQSTDSLALKGRPPREVRDRGRCRA